MLIYKFILFTPTILKWMTTIENTSFVTYVRRITYGLKLLN